MRLLTRAEAQAAMPAGTFMARQRYAFPLFSAVFGVAWIWTWGHLLYRQVTGAVAAPLSSMLVTAILILPVVWLLHARLGSYWAYRGRRQWVVALAADRLWIDLRPLAPFTENPSDRVFLELDAADVQLRAVAARVQNTSWNWRAAEIYRHRPWLDIWLDPARAAAIQQIVSSAVGQRLARHHYFYEFVAPNQLRLYWNYTRVRLRPYLEKLPPAILAAAAASNQSNLVYKPIMQVSTPHPDEMVAPSPRISIWPESQVQPQLAGASHLVRLSPVKKALQVVALFGLSVGLAYAVWYVYTLPEPVKYGSHKDGRSGFAIAFVLMAIVLITTAFGQLRVWRNSLKPASWVMAVVSGRLYLNLRNPAHPKAMRLPAARVLVIEGLDVDHIHLIRSKVVSVPGITRDVYAGLRLMFISFQFKGAPDSSVQAAIAAEIAQIRAISPQAHVLPGLNGPAVLPYKNGFAITWNTVGATRSVQNVYDQLSYRKTPVVEEYVTGKQDGFVCLSVS